MRSIRYFLILFFLLLFTMQLFGVSYYSNYLQSVVLSDPQNKQPLIYDGTLNAWTNGDEIALTAVQVDSANVTNLVADSVFSRIHVIDTVRVLTSADVTGSSNVDGEATFNDIVTLENDTWLRAKNAAGAGYVNMFKVDGTDIINIGADIVSGYDIIAQYFEAGSGYTRFGRGALGGGSGSFRTAFGENAGLGAIATYLVANGHGAGRDSDGKGCTYGGFESGKKASGDNTSFYGNVSGRYAVALQSCGFGTEALYQSTGKANVTNGYKAGEYMDGQSNVAIGEQAFSQFIENPATTKTFDYDDILSTSTDYIKIVSHGFGSTGSYLNLKYAEGTSSIGGLSDGTIIQFKIINDSTLFCRTHDITSAGTGTGHTLTAQFIYRNSVSLGSFSMPTASYQVMLGGGSTDQVFTYGKFTAMDSIPTDNKDLASKFYVDSHCPTFYGAQMTAVNNITQTPVEADAYILLNVFDQDVSATNGWTYHGGSSGTGTAFSDYSGTVAGATLVTSAGHGLDDNCVISIYNTTNYNGIYQITTVGIDAFYIIKAFVVDDGASDWDCADYFELTDPAAEGMYRVVGTLSFRVALPASVTLECFSFVNENPIFGIERFFPNNDLSTMTGGGLRRFEVGDRWGIGVRHNGSSNVLVSDAVVSIQKVGH